MSTWHTFINFGSIGMIWRELGGRPTWRGAWKWNCSVWMWCLRSFLSYAHEDMDLPSWEVVYVCLFSLFIAVSTIATSTKRHVMFCTISAPLFMASTSTSPAAPIALDGTFGRRDWIDKPAASRHHFCVTICVVLRRGWIRGPEQLPVWLCPSQHVVAMVALRLSAV